MAAGRKRLRKIFLAASHLAPTPLLVAMSPSAMMTMTWYSTLINYGHKLWRAVSVVGLQDTASH